MKRRSPPPSARGGGWGWRGRCGGGGGGGLTPTRPAENGAQGGEMATATLGSAPRARRQYAGAAGYFRKSYEIAGGAGAAPLGGMCVVNHAEVPVGGGR